MTKDIMSKVIVGVVSAIVLAALALIWNAVTSGGLVRVMGGVTQDQLGSAGFIPNGAVLAFDFSPSYPVECPEGWRSHRELRGRMIVGAGEHSNRDENGATLSKYGMDASGGAEKHVLTEPEMPSHSHRGKNASAHNSTSGNNLHPWTSSIQNFQVGQAVENTGGGEAHNNMSPYLALLYCIKE